MKGNHHVQAAAQHLRLVAGLTVQRDEAVLDRALDRPQLLDDADLIVGNVAKYVRYAQQDHTCDRYRDPNGRLG
ncbi:hypothetical protein ACVW1C_007262 [Bradyrhizobium sp. USDA 4011]